MNQNQIKYLFERINDIVYKKSSDIKKEYTDKLTEAKKNMIRKNIMNKTAQWFRNQLLESLDYVSENLRYRADFTISVDNFYDKSKLNEIENNYDEIEKSRISKLEVKAREVKDYIMLSDTDKALEMLNKFEKEEF